MLGGFLGAGKTTLLAAIASRYAAAGRSVGLITNDQAEDLVDTLALRAQGFTVGEVAGACFCCSFDDLVRTAGSISEAPPEILLAEPVGSCTDLTATVVLPLQSIYGERFEVAPYGVLFKPHHGRKILGGKASGFSPQAEYIFRKQLEEADYLMIGRSDTLSHEQIEELKTLLDQAAPGVPVMAISPKTGVGVDEVIGYIESPLRAGARTLDIDYDTYAEGEAELGWVNAATTATNSSSRSADETVLDLVRRTAERLSALDGEIAHLKASLMAGDCHAVANVIGNGSEVELGLASGRKLQGPVEVTVNARVASDPERIEAAVHAAMQEWSAANDFTLQAIRSSAFRPGRPVPQHRMTSAT